MSDDGTLYVLYKDEYNLYLQTSLANRRLAHEMLNHFLIIKEPDDWGSMYAALCEYIAITYRFEELLEVVSLSDGWNEKDQCWYLGQELAASVGMFAISEMSCRQELLIHNISLLSH